MADVAFAGQTFAARDSIGAMPLMRFAKVAKGGADSDDMAGLAAMYDLLRACIAEADWPRFEQAADDSGADGEQLMAVVAEVIKVLSERPTSRPSASADGSPTTSGSSAAGFSSPVVERLSTRPDLQLLVEQAKAERQAHSA